RFISSVTTATRQKYGEGDLARYNAQIMLPEETRAEILVLKGIAVAYVMEPRERTPDSDQQRSLLLDLVDVLLDKPEHLNPHLYEMYKRSGEKERKRFIIDQVASLTDQSARLWHSRLCGMLRH
ncbi:MAG: deoxyguanosinetriphosphate triphosphohydrolase, partial [Actinomycetaceae bacterium]|nr:deoxyguanosinetriphosphate triphosphohydrolase [Actinomycetaceae bacterium]